jgi:hypothetical protein
MLALHNSRRRERYAARSQAARSTRPRAAAAAPAAPEPTSARAPVDDSDAALHRKLALEFGLLGGGDIFSCAGDDGAAMAADGDSSLSWLMELTAPRPPSTDVFAVSLPDYAYSVPCFMPATLTLKLPHDGPGALPPAGLRAAAAAAFDALFQQPSGRRGPQVLGLEGAIAPGCTLLLLHALAERGIAEGDASAALRAAMASHGAGGAFLRQARAVLLATHGDVARAEAGALLPRRKAAQAAALPAAVAPLAALSTADVAVPLASGAAPPGAAVRAVFHGQLLRFRSGRASDGAAPATGGTQPLMLRACGTEGVAMLTFAASELDADADADLLLAAAPPRVLLLSPDAALVAEVAAAGAAARTGGNAALAAKVEGAAAALGHALRPGCSPALAARAAAAALELCWRHAARRALQAAVSAAGDDAAALLLPGGATLLHVAAACGGAGACEDVARAGGAGALCGAAGSRCAAGATPLHAAAARRDAAAHAVAASLLSAGGPAAAAAWLAARDCRGVTPSRLAARGAPELAALDAAVRADAASASRVAAVAHALAQECGVFEPSHRAEVASSMLSAAPSASSDAAAYALAAAMLRVDAESPEASDEASAFDAAAPSDDPAASPDTSYSAWLLFRHERLSLGWLLPLVTYHGNRLRHALAARPLGPLMAAHAAHTLTHWKQALPLYRAMMGTWHQLALEIPANLILMLPLLPFAPRAARAWLVRHAAVVLVLQHLTHMVLAALIETALLAREAGGFLIDGAPPVLWPAHLARYLAWGTLLGHVCWPLPGRASAFFLLARGVLPFTRFWLATPMPVGGFWQVGGVLVTGAIVARRERALWPVYRAEMAARRAALKAHAE